MSNKFKNPWDDNNNQGPDLDDIITKCKKEFTKVLTDLGIGQSQGGGFGGGFNPRSLVGGFFSFVVLVWLLSGIYTIQPDEEGVIMRFGKYQRTSNPGLNYKLPAPIESLNKISVTRINKEEVGFRSSGKKQLSVEMLRENTVSNESQMLTTDENIVEINFEVQWVISDAKDYLLNVRDLRHENTVKNVAESAMREVIGLAKVNDVLAEERSAIEQNAKILMQAMLDNIKMGVRVVRVQLLRIDPPREVLDAYRDVQNAKQDKEREINQSLAYRNDIVPRARGEAEQMLQDAEAYKQKVVADAQGESARFSAIYEQYKLAKEVTKKRIYIDTMESIFKDTKKIILDKGATNVVPFLPLGDKLANPNGGNKQ
jgi:membrane protease subunit HflK